MKIFRIIVTKIMIVFDAQGVVFVIHSHIEETCSLNVIIAYVQDLTNRFT